MKERAAEMTAAQQEQEGRVAEALVDDVGSELVKTYNKFINETVPILDSLPESYRPMLLGAHDETITKLRAHVDKARGAKIKAKGAQVNIEIAYAVDAPDDLAELVTLIIPVDPTVQMEWNLRSEDLETWLAARCVQGIYQGFHALGIPEAQCFFGEHNGMLVVEAEVPEGQDKSASDVQKALDKSFATAFSTAGELDRSKVKVIAYCASVDYLLPSDGDEEYEEEEAYA